jgi:hypothetical protein
MSQPFLHDLQISAAVKEPRRGGVPQIMDPDAGQAACLAGGSPYLVVRPVGRDLAVGVPDPRLAGLILSVRAASGYWRTLTISLTETPAVSRSWPAAPSPASPAGFPACRSRSQGSVSGGPHRRVPEYLPGWSSPWQRMPG